MFTPKPEELAGHLREAAGHSGEGGFTAIVCNAAAVRIEELEARLRSYEQPAPLPFKGVDALCAFRECCQPGEDKGSFVTGRGYTSYHAKPRPCCRTNHLHGCPSPLPAADPAEVLTHHFAAIRASARHTVKTRLVIDAAHRALAALFKQGPSGGKEI